MIETPLVDEEYLLQKFPGKGGWTYAEIPQIAPDKKAWFNWVKVRGNIDGYELKHYKLMPMGNGKMFLPVKAEIRKKIGKQEGDYVRVTLYADPTPLQVPQELIECLEAEPPALQKFLQLSQSHQKAYTDWIYSAKKDETKVERIAKTIDNLLTGRLFGKEKP